MPARNRLVPLGPIVVAAVLLSACAARPNVDGGEPHVDKMLTITDITRFSLPLDAYKPDPAAGRTLNQARITLFVRCMQRFGFQLDPPEPSGARVGTNERRYGLVDLAQAEARGYHPPPELLQAGRAPSPQESSPAAQAVAQGTGQRVPGLPEGGCLGEARRKLEEGGTAAADPDLVDRLSFDSYARSQKDSRVQQAVAAWSACMRRAGYDYTDPMKANDDPAFQRDRPSSQEIATATADVRCRREHNLVGVWATVEAAYQRRAVERNAEQLDVVRKALDAQVRNATRVLAGGG